MTKTVRIENADVSPKGVRVRVQHQDERGQWFDLDEPPLMLDYPSQMATVHVTKTRRFVVEEADA